MSVSFLQTKNILHWPQLSRKLPSAVLSPGPVARRTTASSVSGRRLAPTGLDGCWTTGTIRAAQRASDARNSGGQVWKPWASFANRHWRTQPRLRAARVTRSSFRAHHHACAGFVHARTPGWQFKYASDLEMLMARASTRTHQVKVSLRQSDAMEIMSLARHQGTGSGTVVRRLALAHLTAVQKSEVAAVPAPARESDTVRFGHHIAVWFTDEEHALLQRFSAAAGFTVSGYLGRCVLEPWLRFKRRNALAKMPAMAETPRRP